MDISKYDYPIHAAPEDGLWGQTPTPLKDKAQTVSDGVCQLIIQNRSEVAKLHAITGAADAARQHQIECGNDLLALAADCVQFLNAMVPEGLERLRSAYEDDSDHIPDEWSISIVDAICYLAYKGQEKANQK